MDSSPANNIRLTAPEGNRPPSYLANALAPWRFLQALEFKQITEPDSNVLMVAGRTINAETATDVEDQPSWIGLPAMMKMRISTPHYLGQMKGKASPFGFVLHPRTREKLKMTLLTPFSKKRAGWAHSVCINTHDGESYHFDELSRADIIPLGDVLCGYVQHAEIKSLGPDGGKCKPHTRGLLRRMVIHGGLQHCIGKEVSPVSPRPSPSRLSGIHTRPPLLADERQAKARRGGPFFAAVYAIPSIY